MTTRSDAGDSTSKPWSWLDLSDRRLLLLAATLYANVVIAVMGDLLFTGGDRVLSVPGGGIDARFAAMRAFTAEAVGDGEIPLWNPTIFSGMPHLGGFESALFYPPSLIFRVLPLAAAINADIALHLFFTAVCMFLWLRRHQLHPLAAMYGGIVVMLSGAYFVQVKSGDLAVLEAYAWVPAALLSVHNLSRGRLAAGVLGVTAALTMPLFCGYPPAVIHIGLAAFLYGACMFAPSDSKKAMTRGALIVSAAVPALAAAQLFPGLQTYGRSVRLHGDSPTLQAEKALSVSDLIAAVAPWHDIPLTSGGATALFLGISTLVAIVYGLIFGTGRLRFAAMAIAPALLFFASIPRFSFTNPVYHYMLEGRLLAIPAIVFLTAIGCVGLDVLIRRPQGAKRMAAIGVGVAVVLSGAALALRGSIDGAALRALLTSAGIAVCAAAAMSLVPIDVRFRYGLVALGIVEMYVFAITNRPSTTLDFETNAAGTRSETRVFNVDWHNPAPATGPFSANGSTALPARRYMELLAQTQWTELPRQWNGPLEFDGYHPLLRMLRVNEVVSDSGPIENRDIGEVLPRFLLITDYAVTKDRAEAFAIMNESGFDPRYTVLLEQQPTPRPRGEIKDAPITVADESLNAFALELTLNAPAILVMTDAYAPGWRARGLSGSSQWQYDVLPANVALRAIPLGAGAHRIRVEYAPLTYRIGRWISLAAVAALAGFAAVSVQRRRSHARTTAQHSG